MGKPNNWKKLSVDDRKQMARNLLFSMRGNYIVSQALYYGIRELKKVKYPEISNIEDMEMLKEMLFTIFISPEMIKKIIKRSKK